MGIINSFIKALTPTTPVAPPADDPAEQVFLGRPLVEWVTRLRNYESLYCVAYLACEQTKARSLGQLPFAVYRKDGETRTRVEDHPLAKLVNGMANDAMTGRDLRHWLSIRRDTMGTAYLRVEWVRGIPRAIWPVNVPVRVDFDIRRPLGRRMRYLIPSGDKYTPAGSYPGDEIIAIKTAATADGVEGESLARLAARDIGLSVDMERFYESMLRNGNHQLGHVEVPDKIKSDEQLSDIRSAIAAKQGVSNAGKAPIFTAGAKWVVDQQTMRDASLIEQQEWVFRQVCRACSVPPQKVYDLSGQTYSNAEASRIDYATDTIGSEAADIETALARILESMGQPDHYVKFDLDGLMRGDAKSRGQFYREMLYAGVYDRNEVRAKEDMNPRPGLDKPFVPTNYGLVEEDGSVTVLASNGREPGDGMQTGTTD